MKKGLVALAAFVSVAASAANFVQVEQENVQARQNGDADSKVTYLRAGKDFGDYSVGLQSRTARFSTNSIANSLEATVANKNVSVAGITPFIGMGHDFGGTGAGFNYGLVGATTGAKVGPGLAYAGLKTRVLRQNDADPKQTVGFVGYSVPVAKDVAFNVGLSRSGQDIKERGVSAGLQFGF
jgi:hypothetical protein